MNQHSIPSVLATTLISLGILGFLAVGVHPVPVSLALIGIFIHVIKSRLVSSYDERTENHNNLGRKNSSFPVASLIPIIVVLGMTACLVYLAINRLEYSITQESEGYGSAVFRFIIAPITVVTLVGLALIPSVKMFRRGRRGIDLAGVILSSLLLVLVVIAWIIIEPIRNHLIFHR